MANTFEQSMAALAENRISSEHANLVKYRQGFVLLDFDEQDSKAFGIYRFLIGSVPCMMPIVIRNGELDGLDILIIRDIKLFVPAVDGWINMISSLGPRGIADLLPKKDKTAKGAAQVSIRLQDFPYMIKTASVELCKEEFDALMSGLEIPKYASVEEALTVQPFSRILPDSPVASYMVAKAAKTDADYHDRFVSVFGMDSLRRALQTGSALVEDSVLKVSQAEPEEKLYVITDIGDPRAAELKPSQKCTLIDRGQFIVDKRAEAEVAEVYANPEALSLRTNPTAGRWDILTADGRLVPCEVFYADPSGTGVPKPVHVKEQGLGVNQKQRASYVVLPLHTDGFMEIEEGRQLFCLPSKIDPDKWMSKGVEANAANFVKLLKKPYEKNGKCLCVFICSGGCADSLWIDVNVDKPELSTCDGLPIVFTDRFRRVRRNPHCVYIPTDARMFERVYTAEKGFVPGTPSDLSMRIKSDTGAKDLNINLRGTMVQISGGIVNHQALSENEAVRSLVYEAGIQASQAYSMVRKAVGFKGKTYGCLVKQASPDLPPVDPTVVQHSTPQTTVTMADKTLLDANVSGMTATARAPEELFTSEMLQQILQMTDFREISADTLHALSAAMNEAGRLLLRILVHRDEYEERYGEDDTERLQTTCQKQFTGNGDMVLFLREKRGSSGQSDNESLMDLLSEDMG
jgi:hypothetical protein